MMAAPLILLGVVLFVVLVGWTIGRALGVAGLSVISLAVTAALLRLDEVPLEGFVYCPLFIVGCLLVRAGVRGRGAMDLG